MCIRDRDTTGNNVVKGKLAIVSSNQEVGDQWNVANMTDGDDGTKTDYGYTSAILGTEGLESFHSDPPLTVDFTFDQPTELASLKLYCRTGICLLYTSQAWAEHGRKNPLTCSPKSDT